MVVYSLFGYPFKWIEDTLLNAITGKYKHSSKGKFFTIQKYPLLAESSLLPDPLDACLHATFLPPAFSKNNSREIMGGKNSGCLELSNSLSFSSPVLSLFRQACCSASVIVTRVVESVDHKHEQC